MKYLYSIFFFLLVMVIQVYGGRSFSSGFFINLPLIFLVLIFPYFPYWYTFSLSFLTALILDALAGGMANFVALFLALFLGVVILYFWEKSSFVSQIILGEIMISIYFLTLFLLNYFSWGHYLGLILFLDCLGTATLYLLLSLAKSWFFFHHYEVSRLS